MIRGIVFALALLAIWLGVLLLAAGVSVRAPLRPAAALAVAGRDFQVRSGSGSAQATGLEVAALGADGTGLQTVNLKNISAEQLPILRYRIANFPKTLELALVFRRADEPADVQSISLPAPLFSEGVVDLGAIPGWRGEITEIGFADYAAAQMVPPSRAQFQPFRIEAISLRERSWSDVFARLRLDWFGYQPWTLLSISALGPAMETMPRSSLTKAIGCGVLLSLLAAGLILRPSRRRFLGVAVIALVAAWVFLDLRWLADLLDKHEVIEMLYAGKSWDEREAIQPDEATYAAMTRVRELAQQRGSERVFVVSDSRYTLLRMIYFLQPLNTASLVDVVSEAPAATLPQGALVAVFESESAYDATSGLLDVAGGKYAMTPVAQTGDLRVYKIRGGAQ